MLTYTLPTHLINIATRLIPPFFVSVVFVIMDPIYIIVVEDNVAGITYTDFIISKFHYVRLTRGLLCDNPD